MTARLSLFAAVPLLLAGCSAAPAGGPSTVRVAIEDYRITATPASVSAGDVTLNVMNSGGTIHELEVFTLPAGVDAATIPVDHYLAQTESVGMEDIDEVEGIVPNGTPTLTLSLAPGRYALICNLPGHYALGMYSTLTVQ